MTYLCKYTNVLLCAQTLLSLAAQTLLPLHGGGSSLHFIIGYILNMKATRLTCMFSYTWGALF